MFSYNNNLIYEKHIHHRMVYQFVWRVVTIGIIVRIDIKIKRKNKDLRQIIQIFKLLINRDLQKRVPIVS